MTLAMRAIFELITQSGNDPACSFDSDEEVIGGLQITGDFIDRQQRVKIGPAEVDTAVAIPDSIALLVYSDQPVDMRLAGAETPMTSGRIWAMGGTDETQELLTARNLLFSGNGTNEAVVFIWSIEKP
jgi:hypothetical protein